LWFLFLYLCFVSKSILQICYQVCIWNCNCCFKL
jgi:hypothetical protein